MATLPKVENSGGIDDIVKLFTGANSLFGSGKTTTKETGGTATQTSTLSPEAGGQANDLLAKIFGDSSGENVDNIINNIFLKAREAMGPSLMASLGAGNRALTDTTLAQIQSQAVARATSEAAQVKLDAMNRANSTASQLVQAKLESTKTTTTTRPDVSKQTTTGASPTGKALTALGLGAKALKVGKSAKDFYNSREATPGAEVSEGYTNDLTSYFNSGGQASDEASIPLDAFGPSGTDAPTADLANAIDANTITDAIPDPFTEEAATALQEAFAPQGGVNSTAAAGTTANVVSGIEPSVLSSLQSQGVTTPMLTSATNIAESEGGNLQPVYDETGNVTGFVDKNTGEPIDYSNNGAGSEELMGGEADTSVIGNGGADTLEVTGEGTDLAVTDAAAGSSALGTVALPFTILDALAGGGISQGAVELGYELSDSAATGTENLRQDTDPGSLLVSNEDLPGGVLDDTNLPDPGSVICTESHRQGLLSTDLFVNESFFNRKRITKTTLNGYQFLAAPIVLRMRKDSKYAKKIAKFVNAYCNHIVGNHNFLGFLIKNFGEPICTLVGHFVPEQQIRDILYG